MYRILLVDDDPNIVHGISTIIKNHFPDTLEISTAYDGHQALTYLTKHYYHIIISDIRMPQLDGIRLLETIQKAELSSTVIMLSGFDDYVYIRSALRLGAYDYLLKPVNINNFTEMLANILPDLADNTQTLPADSLTLLSDDVVPDNYFDLLPAGSPGLTPEQIAEKLLQLQLSILELDHQKVSDQIDNLFHNLSETQVSKTELKQLFSDFVYALIQRNHQLIKIIARCKLTENDLTAQIKSQPHLSQLKVKFRQILPLYIEYLEGLQKKNDEYIVKKAQAYIAAHCSDQLLLSDLAAQFSLHPNYFSYLFKKQANMTVRDYILQTRIAKAQEMMRNPALKLLDIALAVGYQDAAHFNRAFKNVVGIPPSQYRSSIEMDL